MICTKNITAEADGKDWFSRFVVINQITEDGISAQNFAPIQTVDVEIFHWIGKNFRLRLL